ncbi:MAG: 16S rRNA (cytosine(1402)-N(4))-methyltransferase RsmH [Bacteroidaceae bacterium]|nr:16S rRNA (cytosine(1402)-N(4))-methyltransferase RsmH [Bacteroidaceae bacterium]
MMNYDSYHIPVMLYETVEGLGIHPDGVYVDLTFGGGGHSREIMRHLGERGHLYGFDQDLDAMKGALDDPRFTFVRSNFRFLKNWMLYYGQEQVDGIVADLGVSSHHLDTADRGFSFRYDAPLDMRMNQKATLTAEAILQTYSEQQLADVLYLYGELKNSRQLAAALVKARAQKNLHTTGDLEQTLAPLMRGAREKKDLAKVFQALRIEVNGELRALREMLNAAAELLRPGGRLVVLTYHSLEDRMVKNMVRTGNVEGKTETDLFGHVDAPLHAVTRNVVTPSAEELAQNPRSRSAKLRIAEKTKKEDDDD